MKLRDKLTEYISLDYRSLALMRFAIGLLIILDLISRARSLTAHYTDVGTLSRADVLTNYGGKFLISLHMMSGLGIVQVVLFILAGIFALMLMFGYRTRLATLASWVLMLSLQARNPMVLQGADIAFRVTLFWMLFLPTGKRWSLDRLFGRTARAVKDTIASPATLAYIVQIVLFYLFSGLLKTGAAWQDGTAVYYALSVDQLVRPLGEHLRTWRAGTHFLTYATHYFEAYGSILYFIPWKTGLFRTIGIVLFALMQIGFNISLHLGFFGAIGIAITFGMLPPYFWESWVAPLIRKIRAKAQPGLSIYYDGDCGFCFKMVHIIRNFLVLSASTKIAIADENPEATEIMTRENSWVVVDTTGTTHTGFDGFITVIRNSPVLFWLAPFFSLTLIRTIGESIYSKVAGSRTLVCLPEPTEKPTNFTLRFIGGSILLVLTAYIIFWNIDKPWSVRIIAPFNSIAWTLRLDQRFNMFSPTPLTEDGWYIIPGVLANGEKVDIFKNGPMLTKHGLFPVSFQKPKHIANGYPNQRWQKYLMNIAEAGNSQYRLAYGQYLCRTWNAKHVGDETLETFKILYMIENTPKEGEQASEPELVTLWIHQCFDTLPPPPPESENAPIELE